MPHCENQKIVGVEHCLAYRVMRELKRLGFDALLLKDGKEEDNFMDAFQIFQTDHRF